MSSIALQNAIAWRMDGKAVAACNGCCTCPGLCCNYVKRDADGLKLYRGYLTRAPGTLCFTGKVYGNYEESPIQQGYDCDDDEFEDVMVVCDPCDGIWYGLCSDIHGNMTCANPKDATGKDPMLDPENGQGFWCSKWDSDTSSWECGHSRGLFWLEDLGAGHYWGLWVWAAPGDDGDGVDERTDCCGGCIDQDCCKGLPDQICVTVTGDVTDCNGLWTMGRVGGGGQNDCLWECREDLDCAPSCDPESRPDDILGQVEYCCMHNYNYTIRFHLVTSCCSETAHYTGIQGTCPFPFNYTFGQVTVDIDLCPE